MKILALTMCLLIVVGCSTTQSEKGRLLADLKSADIYGFNTFTDPLCTCPKSVDDYLKELTRETNALLGPGKEVQFVFRPPPLMKKDEPIDPFLKSNTPCPIHSSSNTSSTYNGQNFITAWERLKLISDLCNLSIGIDPENRTVILYGKGSKVKLELYYEDQYRQRLKNIMLPEIQFKNASIKDVILYLEATSMDYDPSGRMGEEVTILIDSQRLHMNYSKAKPITFHEKNISLFDAMEAMIKLSGLEYRIGPCVIIDKAQE